MLELRKTSQWKLIEEHIAFAQALARKFYKDRQNIGVELDDYVGAAFLGLCDAAQRFDPERGQNFRTFSYFRIQGSMYDLLRKGGGISRTCFSTLVDREGEDEQRLPFSMAKDRTDLAHLAVVIEQYGIRIHAFNGQDGIELSYAEEATPETVATRRDMDGYIARLIEDLPEREQKIIRRRYFEAETFDEMRTQFDGVSKSWLSRLHNRALERLRTRMQAEHHHIGGALEAYVE